MWDPGEFPSRRLVLENASLVGRVLDVFEVGAVCRCALVCKDFLEARSLASSFYYEERVSSDVDDEGEMELLKLPWNRFRGALRVSCSARSARQLRDAITAATAGPRAWVGLRLHLRSLGRGRDALSARALGEELDRLARAIGAGALRRLEHLQVAVGGLDRDVGAPEEREGERGGVCEVAAAAIAAAISSGSLPSTGPGESSNRSADASARRAAART